MKRIFIVFLIAILLFEAMPESAYAATNVLYAGLGTTPAQLKKIDTSTMSTVSTWTGDTGQNYIFGIAYDNTNLYVSLMVNPAQVLKINPTTMTTISPAWVAPTGKAGRALLYANGYIYMGSNTSPGNVYQINPVTMLTTAYTWTGAAGQNNVYSLAYDGTSIYAGMNGSSPAQVVQITPATMVTSASWVGTAAQNKVDAVLWASPNIYAGLDDLSALPAQTIKITPSTMTTASSWTGTATELYSFSLAHDGTNLFVGIESGGATGSDGVIEKINTGTMTSVAPSWFLTGGLAQSSMTFGGGNIYHGLLKNPGEIYQITPSTMTTALSWIGAAGENVPRALLYVAGVSTLTPAKKKGFIF